MPRKRRKGPANIRVDPVTAAPKRGPNAAGQWYWRVMWGPRTDQQFATLGWFHRDDARAELIRQVADGTVGLAPIMGDGSQAPKTVKDLLDYYVAYRDQRTQLDAKTKTNDRNFAKHVVAVIGAVSLRQVRWETLDRYKNDRLSDGGAPSSVKKEIKVLRAAWRWGADMGAVSTDRLPRIQIADRRVRCSYIPSFDEATTVEEALTGWLRLAVHLLVVAGPRINGVTRAPPSAFRLDAEPPEFVIKDKTREGKSLIRRVPLGVRTVALVCEHGNLTDPTQTILGVKDKYAQRKIREAITKVCEAEGIPRFTPHALRKTLSKHFKNNDIDIRHAADWLGHSPQTMLKFYRESDMADFQEVQRKTRLGEAALKGDVLEFPIPG